MLKRSFAESRAQMAAPETLKAITAAQEQLAGMQDEPWPDGALGTTREHVEAFHSACVHIWEAIHHVQVGA